MPSQTDKCAICQEYLGLGVNGPLRTAMGHTVVRPDGNVTHAFHLHCIAKWQGSNNGNNNCPTCRAGVNPWVEVALTNPE